MYGTIVRNQIRKAFQQINAGDYDSVVAQFAPNAEHVFYGTHALSGSRFTPASIRQWYTRLATLFPTLHFDLQQIMVSGWPWDTYVAVAWVDHIKSNDGATFTNQGVHIFGLRWGKVVSLHIYCDTVILGHLLAHLAAHGIIEATAAPIEDQPRIKNMA